MDTLTIALDRHTSRSAATSPAQGARFRHMNTTATDAERQHESGQTAATEVSLNRRIIGPLQKSKKLLSSLDALDGVVGGMPGGVVLGSLGLITAIGTLAGSSALVDRILQAKIGNLSSG